MYGLGTPYRLAFFNGPKRKIDDVLLEHVGLPHVLPLTVHLDFEHLPNTQHSGVIGPSIRTMFSHPDPLKVIGWMSQSAI